MAENLEALEVQTPVLRKEKEKETTRYEEARLSTLKMAFQMPISCSSELSLQKSE